MFNLICFRRQPIYPVRYKNIPIWASSEEIQHIRMNLAYSDAEKLVQPMECDEDHAGDINILLKQVSGKSEEVENVMNNDDTSYTNTNSQSLVMPEESKNDPKSGKEESDGSQMSSKGETVVTQKFTESDQKCQANGQRRERQTVCVLHSYI